jgi:hypothetical protein
MRQIGTIKLLQIQTGKLKIGTRPQSYYDPKYLLAVARLLLTPEGAHGITQHEEKIIDIHHARHPESRNNVDNPITIGFTIHYAKMRQEYGAHLTDGIAGENIIIETAEAFGWDDVVQGVAIQHNGTLHQFRLLKVAAPCFEFSHFAAGKNAAHGDPLPGAELKTALQFLDGGTRGFHISPLNDHEPVSVATGDAVFVME